MESRNAFQDAPENPNTSGGDDFFFSILTVAVLGLAIYGGYKLLSGGNDSRKSLSERREMELIEQIVGRDGL